MIRNIDYIPESIPDHSFLYCDLESTITPDTNCAEIKRSTKYNLRTMPNDFLMSADIQHSVLLTIMRIENYIRVERDVQSAYDEFETLIKTEMKDKISTYKNNPNGKRRQYKPYWNNVLQNQWSKVCESKKAWLRFAGSNGRKRALKETYCNDRKTFDRLNRKFKRNYQLQQQQNLEDKVRTIAVTNFPVV